ncbi:MAG: hypothetical protein ACXAB2_16525 [Candidatus Hodarchaeales archaeon]
MLEIEDLRAKERKLIHKLWRDIQEDTTRRLHKMVFEQALQSDSMFPSMNENELDKWITENISAVVITLIEQGDILVREEKPSKIWETGVKVVDRIKSKFSSKNDNENT